MLPSNPRLVGLLVFVVGLLLPLTVQAQLTFNADPRPRTFRAVTVGYYQIDFEFDGKEDPVFSFDFKEPAYGVILSSSNLLATFGIGTQNGDPDAGTEDLRLIDLSLSLWGELYFSSKLSEGETRAFFPILLYGGFRRVTPDDSANSPLDAFNVSVFGLGTGLGFYQHFGRASVFEVRVNPAFGLATTSFSDAIGSSRLFDADLQFHLGNVFGVVGLTLGYNVRAQNWNVNVSNLFPDITEDLFDYAGTQHLFRVGLNW